MKCGKSVLKFMEETLRQVMGPERFTGADALEFKLRVSREYGGGLVYIPKAEKDARREVVLREFNGRNRKALCEQLGLSKAQFYRYLKGECDGRRDQCRMRARTARPRPGAGCGPGCSSTDTGRRGG